MSRRSLFRLTAAAGGVLALPLATGSARASGFWYTGETDPHERTFLQWPVNRSVFDDPDFLFDHPARTL